MNNNDTDKKIFPNEPDIIINEETLTDAESMTIRVAIESFAMDLENGLGEDKLGKQITEGYKG